ncbi:hypothetical protein KJI95_18635 [Shewanella sp. JM162201]|uniref:PepSY-associated TM helix n=1 Tax=Shewanella jiangmenensis TaxID=2837387 RepID=A0ABS5V7U0_9GAMM|nr:hypothetical protein [Shewanella jiangmenensis]MBT1446515.1 hypothetical protein [Shewanella jiangmenensis]
MTSITQVRRLHRLLAPIIGLQLLLWSLSGAYMVLTNISDIHGDFLISEPQLAIEIEKVSYSFAAVGAQFPDATQIRLKQTSSGPVYLLRSQGRPLAISARTGEPLPIPDEAQIRSYAKLVYTSDDSIISVTKFEDTAPAEINPRLLPLWRVDFDAPLVPSLYFSATTGELVGKRHHGWRLFDIMWMLHIMDYDTRENIHNNLLRIASALALLLALSGSVLAWRSIRAPQPPGNEREEDEQQGVKQQRAEQQGDRKPRDRKPRDRQQGAEQ